MLAKMILLVKWVSQNFKQKARNRKPNPKFQWVSQNMNYMFDHYKMPNQNNPSTSMSKEFQRKTERAEEIQSKKTEKYKIFIFADELVPSLISPTNNILGI
jgi:hypothetical protein